MLKSDSLTIRSSEIKARLNEIAGVDELTDEIRQEEGTLQTELRDVETRRRAALAAEGTTETATATDGLDAEGREKLELRGKANLGAFILSALQGRIVSGADAEYAAAFGAPAGEFPLDIFERDRPENRERMAGAPLERRAVTPAPATGTGVVVAPVQPFVFAPSIAPRIGIEMPSVPSGSYSEMTISTSVPAAPKAKGDNADDTAGALTPTTAAPRRISARMSVTVEDVASVGQANFEAALRQNTSMRLSDEYDRQAINGDGQGVNVEGLIAQLTDPTDPSAVATFDSFVAAYANAIDGLWASMVSEIGIVCNVDAYRLAAQTFRDAAADLGAVSFASYASTVTGGFWTNKRMPATDGSNIARGIVYRKGQTGLRTACHPTWGTIGIDDIYTDSRSGQRHFTVHTLVGSKVLIVQPDAYDLVEFQVA